MRWISVFIVYWFVVNASAQNFMTAEDNDQFLKFLHKEKELELVLHIQQKRFESKIDTSLLPLLTTCYQLKQYDKVLSTLQVHFKANDFIAPPLYTLAFKSQLQLQQYPIKSTFKTDDNTQNFFKLGNLLIEHQFKAAQDSQWLMKCSSCDKFSPLIAKSILIKEKNPYVAMVMSTLIPGAGKLYLHQNRDGITAFVLIVSMAWQSLYGFDHKGIHSYYGWVNGLLAVGFYSGNIWGAYHGTKKYNRGLKNKITIESREIMLAY
jgi:TM2 domain-containing membrane protein YozV